MTSEPLVRQSKTEKEESRIPTPQSPSARCECRHTFSSMGIADGVNARLTGYLGHSSIQMTFDRHLLPGKETEAADLLNAYLARARDPAIGDET